MLNYERVHVRNICTLISFICMPFFVKRKTVWIGMEYILGTIGMIDQDWCEQGGYLTPYVLINAT